MNSETGRTGVENMVGSRSWGLLKPCASFPFATFDQDQRIGELITSSFYIPNRVCIPGQMNGIWVFCLKGSQQAIIGRGIGT
ncbi:hypothetical protein Hanom_Chr14g01262751 [Helianthus anomalus]